VDDYLCLTLVAKPGETEPAFKARLSELWTRLCRARPETFEKVYAETVAFEPHGDRLTRKYLVESAAADSVAAAAKDSGLDHIPIDPDDLFSKYEAAPPDWFWIEH
jgi:hypothetical protein